MDKNNKQKPKSKYKNIISFRVTEFEYQKVNKLFAGTNLTRSDFMRNLITELQTENILLTQKN